MYYQFSTAIARRWLVMHITAFLLLSLVLSCETFYEDRFSLTAPKEQEITFVYPGLASVKFIQTAGTSSTYPAKDAQLKAIITRLNPKVTGSFTVIMSAYMKTPLTSENLGFTKTINAVELSSADSVIIDLGSSYSLPLKKELLQLHILDAGWEDDEQSDIRGIYSGTYTVEKEDEILMKGALNGIINYKGEASLEVYGINAFRFVTGLAVKDKHSFDIYYTALDSDGSIVAPLSGVASVTDDMLTGKLGLSIPAYDSLKISITKNQ